MRTVCRLNFKLQTILELQFPIAPIAHEKHENVYVGYSLLK